MTPSFAGRSSSQSSSELPESSQRVVITGVYPEIEGGRFPIKRVVGERVNVSADIFADGHEMISAVILFRAEGESLWHEARMEEEVNDRWHGVFHVRELGRHEYTLQAWIDHFSSWRRDFKKKLDAGQDVSVDILVGADLVEQTISHVEGQPALALRSFCESLRSGRDGNFTIAAETAQDRRLAELMAQFADRSYATTYGKILDIEVDSEKARFSAWYEMFPRSASADPGRQGTLQDCIKRLPYVAEMGFDVLYLPPIHPIGMTHRKGRNNAAESGPDDVGSPWAIGNKSGGHTAIDPQLGTLEDFHQLIEAARRIEIDVALDVAFQCSPDHPWVSEHPSWFRWRPDGTVQYAENPPKKYEDIYPLNFESSDWRELWKGMKGVFEFWMEQGIRIFRVDNPHTKPFNFWEWLIRELKSRDPEVIFLAEAFTRPKVMYRLAQLGFTQSYTYFAWRNNKWELEQYFTELTQTGVREFFRPNLWPNTPDILNEYLQTGGRPAFMVRLILASMLGANYGIYGPAFELGEREPIRAGSEEYMNSEKYEVKHWDLNRGDSLKGLIATVNRIRKQNPALRSNERLRFHAIDNGQLIAFSKTTEDLSNAILVIVNLDPHNVQRGWVDLPLDYFGLDGQTEFQMHDLLTDARYIWRGARNYIELNPLAIPAHIFRLRRRVRDGQGFDYFS